MRWFKEKLNRERKIAGQNWPRDNYGYVSLDNNQASIDYQRAHYYLNEETSLERSWNQGWNGNYYVGTGINSNGRYVNSGKI